MAEIGRFQLEAERGVPDRPSFGQSPLLDPLPDFIFAPLEAGIGARPDLGGGPLEWSCRRAGPVERERAKSLQPPACAKIKQLIFFVGQHG